MSYYIGSLYESSSDCQHAIGHRVVPADAREVDAYIGCTASMSTTGVCQGVQGRSGIPGWARGGGKLT